MKPRKRFLKSRPGRFCDHWPTPKVQPGLLELIDLSGFHRSSDLAHSGHMHLLKHFRILIFETDSAIQFRILIFGTESRLQDTSSDLSQNSSGMPLASLENAGF
jgi:hypothetical protein